MTSARVERLLRATVLVDQTTHGPQHPRVLRLIAKIEAARAQLTAAEVATYGVALQAYWRSRKEWSEDLMGRGW